MKKFYLFFVVSFLISFNANAQVPSYVPTTGLVGWWPFNANANDESGNGNNGTVNGATLTADRFGNINSAYNFDGINDYIQLQAPSLNNAITISFWAYDDGGYPNTYSINPRYVSSEFCNGGFALVNNVNNSPNGIFFSRNRGSSSADIFSTVSSTYQVNQHLVFTYDGTTGKFYINGNLLSSINNAGNITTSANLFFGKSGCNNAGQMIDAFKGKLDDIGIWNRALTAQEIADLYIGCATPVTITTQPTSQTVCENTLASFNVTATGAGTLAYQWYKNGTSIAGATNSSYAIASAAITDTGRYSVKITSSVCGEKISQVAVLSVGKQAKVLTQPINKSLCGNASASFSVVASGAGTLTYQWKKDGVNITGANASTYIIANAKVNDEGLYSCLVTSSSCGNELSSEASLTIPHFTTQPTSQTVSSGMNVTFNVAHSQTNATYQWQSDLGFGFQNLSNAGQYSGATTKQLTITGVTASNKNQLFRCIVSSSPCVDTSTTSTIYVTTAGINTKANNHGIQLQPNPASEYIRITVEANLVGAAYTVLNENGKVIMKGVIAEENTTLSLRDFATGVYLFRIGNSSVQTFKVVKK